MDTSPRSGRIRNVLAAAVVGVALAVGGYLVGLDSRPPPAPPPSQPRDVAPEQTAEPAAAQTMLDRAGVIAIAAAAADSFAGGRAEMGSLAGRRFAVRIPFGCSGPATEDAATGWRYDEEQQSLRVRVTLAEWGEADWVTSAIPEGSADAIEGFWIPRPWTRSEQCAADSANNAANWASSVGIAQFFGADSDRASQRRGRPLEVVAKVAPDAVPARGLHLAVEGRLAEVPGRRSSVLCHAASASQRPTCLVAAQFERISVIDPASGAELANWRL